MKLCCPDSKMFFLFYLLMELSYMSPPAWSNHILDLSEHRWSFAGPYRMILKLGFLGKPEWSGEQVKSERWTSAQLQQRSSFLFLLVALAAASLSGCRTAEMEQKLEELCVIKQTNWSGVSPGGWGGQERWWILRLRSPPALSLIYIRQDSFCLLWWSKWTWKLSN